MKYYIIAGEASGDMHGANLIKSLFAQDSEAEIRCWGGDKMQAAGAVLAKHYCDLAFMGLSEVLLNFRKISKNFAFCKSDISEFVPDVLVFIDYSGFNLRIAKWAKEEGFYTAYYIAPQVWASRAKRVLTMKECINEVYVTLPFEQSFYKNEFQYDVHFVGHPLLDEIANKPVLDGTDFRRIHSLDDRPIIAVLPGSRTQEIRSILPEMASIVNDFPDYQFVIAKAPSQSQALYDEYTNDGVVKVVDDCTYDLLNTAYAAVVTSGTATLETALFRVPQVVCYKGSWLTYQLAKRILTLKFICLVNLIMDREVVKELIQGDCSSREIKRGLAAILATSGREQVLRDYDSLREKIGKVGASERAATLIVQNYKDR